MAPAEPKTPKDTQGGALALLTTTTSIRICGIQDGVVKRHLGLDPGFEIGTRKSFSLFFVETRSFSGRAFFVPWQVSRRRIPRSQTQRRARLGGAEGALHLLEASENSWTLVWISDQARPFLRAEPGIAWDLQWRKAFKPTAVSLKAQLEGLGCQVRMP